MSRWTAGKGKRAGALRLSVHFNIFWLFAVYRTLNFAWIKWVICLDFLSPSQEISAQFLRDQYLCVYPKKNSHQICGAWVTIEKRSKKDMMNFEEYFRTIGRYIFVFFLEQGEDHCKAMIFVRLSFLVWSWYDIVLAPLIPCFVWWCLVV